VRAETRHSLKQDAFSRTTIEAAGSAVHWTVDHKNKLMAGAGILAVLVLAAVGGWYYLSHQDEQASLGLSQALRTMEEPVRPAGTPPQPEYPSFASAQERSAATRKQLQEVVDKYPHTHTADVAHYFLGTTALNTGDNAAAETNLKEVANTGNKDLAALAKLALATLYSNTNRTKDALDLYKQLVDRPTMTVSKVAAQIKLAALYESSQQPAEAKRLYEQIQKENPGSEAGALAQSKIQELK
jgi:predicted negative regulator of RcsB-dependent stress response